MTSNPLVLSDCGAGGGQHEGIELFSFSLVSIPHSAGVGFSLEYPLPITDRYFDGCAGDSHGDFSDCGR
jgi:hypothetical protein